MVDVADQRGPVSQWAALACTSRFIINRVVSPTGILLAPWTIPPVVETLRCAPGDTVHNQAHFHPQLSSMPSSTRPIRFVASSSVRSDIVGDLAGEPATTDELLETLDASSSAIYNALGELEDATLLAEQSNTWTLTGSGRLVADVVQQRAQTEDVLADVNQYLQTHDLSVLPQQFRLRLGELQGATVLEATDTEPNRVVREVSDRLATATRASVVSPIYIESYATNMPDSSASRLVLDEAVARSAIAEQQSSESAPTADSLAVRVANVDFALGVTDAELLLSLPRLDGQYDSDAELVVERDRALDWGEELFEAVWMTATPVREFAETA